MVYLILTVCFSVILGLMLLGAAWLGFKMGCWRTYLETQDAWEKQIRLFNLVVGKEDVLPEPEVTLTGPRSRLAEAVMGEAFGVDEED